MQRLLAAASLASLIFSAPFTARAAEPFNGKDLSGWTTKEPQDRNHWRVGLAALAENPRELAVTEAPEGEKGQLINAQGGGVDIYSDEKFGDAVIEVEVLVPRGSNSGIYVQGEYEVQVFDSFGKEQLGGGDMGAIYGAAPPRVNATKKPGQWNKFVIDFRAPRFNDAGEKTANARFVKVTLNGQTLHEDVEMKGPTPGGVAGKEAPAGPLMFQGDHGPVAYHNIRIAPRR